MDIIGSTGLDDSVRNGKRYDPRDEPPKQNFQVKMLAQANSCFALG